MLLRQRRPRWRDGGVSFFQVVPKECVGDVIGGIGDVEDEVVTEEAGGVLHLEEVGAAGREGFEFDGDGFCFAFLEGGGNAVAVDDDVGFLS